MWYNKVKENKSMTCEMECIDCTNYKCRCEDCVCLVEQNNDWFCEELQEYCKDILLCPEID